MDIWKQIDIRSTRIAGKYIAVSGNTGSGKSTLVRSISAELNRVSSHVIAVDERHFHHPLLPLMFSNPAKFALPIQLNFSVQRGTFLLRSMENRHTIVMERSHYDDRLFVEDHRSKGHIGEAEYNAYVSLACWFDAALPPPDVFVLLDVGENTSFERVKSSEAAGERPVEFPNDSTLRSYINSWHQRYRAFFERLLQERQKGRFPNTLFLRFSELNSIDQMTNAVLATTGRSHADGNRL